MLHLFHKVYSPLRSELDAGVYTISCRFTEIDQHRREHDEEEPVPIAVPVPMQL